MLLNPLILFVIVVKCQLFHILSLYEMRHSFARMDIFIHLHEDLLRHSNNFAIQCAARMTINIFLLLYLILRIINIDITRGMLSL